ncbi:hypothetical protein Taro_002928 [Colocasia esculenta]|uniref:Uncharacterized protein n=1 Tax=Colocasia esculenta TaxID=4460 RepID=A0A843TMB0_COLES|nr:hypothetical protein [Colocasia esculenta]
MAAAEDQHAVLPAKASKLRFPLRSATKPVDKKTATAAADAPGGSATRSGYALSRMARRPPLCDPRDRKLSGSAAAYLRADHPPSLTEQL